MPIPPLPRVPGKKPLLTPASVEAFLLAFGDNDYPLPETVRILDEIITDYIIETCHEAAAVAHHARRAKIKLDDFKFMLRRDTGKLGRVSEMLETDKELKRKRKAFDTDEGAVMADKNGGGGAGAGANEDGGDGGEDGTAGGKKKMGRPKKVRDDEDGEPKKKKKKKDKRTDGDDASVA